MEEDNKAERVLVTILLGVAGLLVLGALFGSFLGSARECSRFEKDAVESGHAEYIINKKLEREWRWLPPCKGKDGPK